MPESELQFMPYVVQVNYKKRKQEILSFSEEEQNAIDKYQGSSVLLNEILGDYISDEAILVPGLQYYTTKFSSNRETVERLLQEAQNLYAAMAKDSYESQFGYRLFRGAARKINPQADQSFISTTASQEEAINWAIFNNRKSPEHYVIELDVEKGVRFLDMPVKGTEEESLLSPFVDVEATYEGGAQVNGTPIKKQRVRIRRRELREISPDEMERLEQEILADADCMAELTTACIRMQRGIKELRLELSDYGEKLNRRYQEMNANKISYADYQELDNFYKKEKERTERRLQEAIEELKEKSAVLSEWKQKIRRLIEGRCRNIEIGLQAQIDQAMDLAREEAFQLGREQAQREEDEREKERQNAAAIRSKIGHTKSLLVNASNGPGNSNPLQQAIGLRNKLRQCQINYESPTERCLQAISRINYDCQYAHDGILERASQIVKLPKKLQEVQRSQPLEREEMNEFARTVETLVVGIRISQEERGLLNAKKSNEAQKVGLVGKLVGKEKRQQEVTAQIDNQIEQLRNFSVAIRSNGLNPDITYSFHNILAEIQIAKLKGNLTTQEVAELERYEAVIKGVFTIRQDRLDKMLYEKTHGDIGGYDTRAFIAQYDVKIGTSQLRGRRITKAEELCYRMVNQIEDDERWQMKRERDELSRGYSEVGLNN